MASVITTTTTTPATPAVKAASTSAAPASKGRKGAAAGGGKAWTAEEEVYLLQMRLERVAYKKIASHLDKTELACRLHYHQLSHGGNRRKRNNSVSSNSSNASNTSPAGSPSADSPATTARPYVSSFSPVNAAGAVQKPWAATSSKIKGKPLLPKPVDGSVNSNGSGMATATPRRQTSAKGGKSLRVHCNPELIDKEKLKRLVKANEPRFWETIAEQYGESMDGEYLRTIWQKDLGSETPPTPAISPASQAGSPTVAEMNIDDRDTPNSPESGASSPTTAAFSSTSDAVAFEGSEVVSIKEEVMDDLMEEDESLKPAEVSTTENPETATVPSPSSC